MPQFDLATIGFTKKNAETFFGHLMDANVKKVIDVRLNNTSQLAGFAKANDLEYFLKVIGNIGYLHADILAPSAEIFQRFKKEKGDWMIFKNQFMDLMTQRKIETVLKAEMFDHACLLCSEHDHHDCHRTLVCEYLNGRWGSCLTVKHL